MSSSSTEKDIQNQLREGAKLVEQSFRFEKTEDGSVTNVKPASSTEAIKQEKSPYTSQTAAAKGALKAVTDYISFDNKKQSEKDDTIVDVKVRNPFHKIMNLLQDIKSKQSTTVSMRFTIPLIALPIVLLAAFQLGRAQTVCASRFTSQIGVLRSLTVMSPIEGTVDVYSHLLSFFPDIPRLQKAEELHLARRTILVGLDGKILDVLHDEKLKMKGFDGEGVILSGNLSPCAGTISLDAEENISLTN